MRFTSHLTILLLATTLSACPMGFSGRPPSNTHVLGFATNCDQGATARLLSFTMHRDDGSTLNLDAPSLRTGDATLKISLQHECNRLPFVMKINEETSCVFASGHPSPLIEADCFKDNSPIPTCQARLNFLGFRPAPEPFESMAYGSDLEPGTYPASKPEELFDEPDLQRALEREYDRISSRASPTQDSNAVVGEMKAIAPW